MKKIIFLICLATLFSTQVESQILDVPYRVDLSGCGNWCWSKSAHMILVYYGNDVLECDVLEYVRATNPSLYNTTDCCNEPDSCCSIGFLSSPDPRGINNILNNWSISTTLDWSFLSVSEIQTELTNNKPFVTERYRYNPDGSISGHVLVAYGYLLGDLYVHDPGNGSAILDYNEFIIRGTDNIEWKRTLKMNSSETTCPLTQHITGSINLTSSTYKASQTIYADVTVASSANPTFLSGGDIILESGFAINLGATVLMKTGETLICP